MVSANLKLDLSVVVTDVKIKSGFSAKKLSQLLVVTMLSYQCGRLVKIGSYRLLVVSKDVKLKT